MCSFHYHKSTQKFCNWQSYPVVSYIHHPSPRSLPYLTPPSPKAPLRRRKISDLCHPIYCHTIIAVPAPYSREYLDTPQFCQHPIRGTDELWHGASLTWRWVSWHQDEQIMEVWACEGHPSSLIPSNHPAYRRMGIWGKASVGESKNMRV